MAVDLHTHSTASDGSDPPAQVIAHAVAVGLSAVALTDHDTLDGIPEASAAAGRLGIELVPGVELSLQWEGAGGMHLLVLFLPPGSGPLRDRLGKLQAGRDHRNQAMVERLNHLGMAIEYAEVLTESGGGSVGRPHIAAVLARHGYVEDISTAFDLWLAHDKPAYVGRPRLEPEEAIALAREEGAVPILAHPHTLGLNTAEEMTAMLSRLTGAGLIGLECHYPIYSPTERQGYADLARRFGLIPSGGSDYHGTYKVGIDLGVGKGDLIVPDAVLTELRPR
ncbi:MAG: PHP domain-containing protein [Acidimicrobiia bacterium]|nr:PHP domain-containing protein [Acidimicrobiia bacterium]